MFSPNLSNEGAIYGWLGAALFFSFSSVNSCEHNCCQSCASNFAASGIGEIIFLRLPCRQPSPRRRGQVAVFAVCCHTAGGGKASQASALRGWQVPLAVGVGCPGAGVSNLLPWCLPAQQRTARGGEAAGGATEERSLYLLVSSDRCNSKQGSVGAVVNRAALVQTEMPYWPSCLYVRHVICNKTSKIQIVVMGSKRVLTSR